MLEHHAGSLVIYFRAVCSCRAAVIFLWSWVTAVWNLIQILVFILISAIWCVSLLFSALQGSITKDENKKTASLSMITIKQLYKWIKSYLVCDFKGRLTLLFSWCFSRWVNGRTVPCPWSTMCGLAMNYTGDQQTERMTTCPSWHWRRLRSSLWKTWIRLVGRAWGTLYPAGNRSNQCEAQISRVENLCQINAEMPENQT